MVFSCSKSLAVFVLICLYFPSDLSAFSNREATQHTLGPVYDYRASYRVDYSSLHVAGPLFKYERKRDESDLALRPLFYRSVATDRDAGLTDLVFPVFQYKRDENIRSYSLLRLINFEAGRHQAAENREFTFFPLVLYRQRDDQPTTRALFPFWGHIYHRFGRDEIRFTLWPLHIDTRRGQTRVSNYLWPFFATVSGESPDESGIKVWPLFGRSEFPGVYRKFFLLWPFWFDYDERLNTDAPVSKRYLFPFYLYRESADSSRRTVLWPFFSYLDDRVKGYTEWNFPWPLWQRASGGFKHGWKFLPFASDMTRNDIRSRWYVWPLLKHEHHVYEDLTRRKIKFLFFVYRDLQEEYTEPERERYRRIFGWPLFGYEKNRRGVAHFYTLALIEPLAPDSDGVKRNWSPLWRLYQRKWDGHGNSTSSFLWNLYWSETRRDAAVRELFPLFYWRREPGYRGWTILKGLVGYEEGEQGRRLKLLYLPVKLSYPAGEEPRAD